MNKPENKRNESAAKNECTKEELKKFHIAIERMLCYQDEEWEAIQNPELMTQELFTRCISTSVQIQDFDIFTKLADKFPDYFDTLFAKIDSHFAKADSELPEISQAVIDTGIKRLEAAIMEMEGQN